MSSVVIGDLVTVNTGDKVPADIRLISADQLKVDRSMLTGESDPVSCTVDCTDSNYMETRNILFMGTTIVEGQGIGVVAETGMEIS